jgi:hypothetical protein
MNQGINLKHDLRPKRGWWAPGGYMNTCTKCGDHFVGDKRAGMCADCAYKEPELKAPASTLPESGR